MNRTYVNDMTSSVKHQVPIVSVLYLQQETHDRVSRHAFDKVCSGLK